MLCAGHAAKDVARVVGLGQSISLLIAGTAVTSEYLARRGVNAPTAQSFSNYLLLSTVMAWRWCTGKRQIHVSWYKYLLLAIADVEANYLVVKAYQFTSITSVMLLDSFSIPCVMLLSRLLLRTRYTRLHVAGVAVCLAGLLVLVLSDAFSGDHNAATASKASASRSVFGDALCVMGAALYACSNVGQEATVKHFDRTEYIGMVGLFGTLVSGLQLAIFERDQLASIHWDMAIAGYASGFAVCMLGTYGLTAAFLRESDAALFNLSVLTADLWTVLAGTVLFSQPPLPLYYLALVLIVAGILMYSQRRVISPASSALLGERRGSAVADAEERCSEESEGGRGSPSSNDGFYTWPTAESRSTRTPPAPDTPDTTAPGAVQIEEARPGGNCMDDEEWLMGGTEQRSDGR
mmetsp:Transcript_7078/g.22401  ORF Transcript_7078/g.22401 Transcript_7078/m.22401 type:complete len:407 (+) Transcript_7078:2-1222(+)